MPAICITLVGFQLQVIRSNADCWHRPEDSLDRILPVAIFRSRERFREVDERVSSPCVRRWQKWPRFWFDDVLAREECESTLNGVSISGSLGGLPEDRSEARTVSAPEACLIERHPRKFWNVEGTTCVASFRYDSPSDYGEGSKKFTDILRPELTVQALIFEGHGATHREYFDWNNPVRLSG